MCFIFASSVHAATGPTPSHFTSPSKPDTETDSTPVKHKKKKSSKGSSTLHVASSDGFGSDWNPFPSSEPTSAPPVVQHTTTTGSKSAHKSKSSSKHIVSATPEPEAPVSVKNDCLKVLLWYSAFSNDCCCYIVAFSY